MSDTVWYDNDKKALCIKNTQGGVREALLRPKEYGIWELLSRHSNEAVSRQQMCDEVWGGRHVTDFTINQTINQLRKKIGVMGKDVIITIPRKGYAINRKLICESTYRGSAISPWHESQIDCEQISVGESEYSCASAPSSKLHGTERLTKRKKVNLTMMIRRLYRSLFKS